MNHGKLTLQVKMICYDLLLYPSNGGTPLIMIITLTDTICSYKLPKVFTRNENAACSHFRAVCSETSYTCIPHTIHTHSPTSTDDIHSCSVCTHVLSVVRISCAM